MRDGSEELVWAVGVLPLNVRINLFCSILVTFIFLRNDSDTVCWNSILILYADCNNTEPWGFLFYN